MVGCITDHGNYAERGLLLHIRNILLFCLMEQTIQECQPSVLIKESYFLVAFPGKDGFLVRHQEFREFFPHGPLLLRVPVDSHVSGDGILCQRTDLQVGKLRVVQSLPYLILKRSISCFVALLFSTPVMLSLRIA